MGSSSHTPEQFHRTECNNILCVQAAETSGQAIFFFSKCSCTQLSCRNCGSVCTHFSQFSHHRSYSSSLVNFVPPVEPHTRKSWGACVWWFWPGPNAVCNAREDVHQLSHPYGFSSVILHGQWQTALEGYIIPSSGYESEWDPAVTMVAILVLHSLATPACTHFRRCVCPFSVFLHFGFLRLWSGSSWKRKGICDVLYIPAMSSYQTVGSSADKLAVLQSAGLPGLREMFVLSVTALNCVFGYQHRPFF